MHNYLEKGFLKLIEKYIEHIYIYIDNTFNPVAFEKLESINIYEVYSINNYNTL